MHIGADSQGRSESTRQRGAGALGVGVLLAALCACGSSYQLPAGNGPGSVGRQQLLAALPEMMTAPAGATLETERRTTGCEDPDSGPSNPEVYRLFRVPADKRARVAANLRREWQAQGWGPVKGDNMSGYHPFIRTVPGGWRAELSLYTQAPDVLEVSAQEADYVPTCETD